MVETWKCHNEDYVFVFGNEVIADVQRREKHSCTDGGSRSTCCFGYVSELTPRCTAPPLSSIAGSAIDRRGYKKVHWKERRLNTLSRVKSVGSRFVCFEFGDEVRSFVRVTTIRVDSQSRCCNLQEFHC